MQIAFYQPDIPQNIGSAMRLAACMGVAMHIIEPCGFIFDDKRIRRSGMDYTEQAEMQRHMSWEAFLAWRAREHPKARLVLLSTKSSALLQDFSFQPDDILVAGRESAGVPDEVAEICDARLRIPMTPESRSLNVVISTAMVLWEGLHQTATHP